jgi:hypothetical protein
LVELCRSLNDAGARYVVVGGMAIIQAGCPRTTEDIDMIVDVSPENVQRVRDALMLLPDAAVRDMSDGDLEQYVVVRIADEIVIDLMKCACGVDFAAAEPLIERVSVDGVLIPFAGPRLLWLTKQGIRDRDRMDRGFLAARYGSKATGE